MKLSHKSVLGSIVVGLVLILAAMLVIASDLPAGRAGFHVPKITCIACSEIIDRELKGLPGVSAVEVDVPNTAVRVSFDEKKTDPGTIAQALGRIGYPAQLVELNGKADPAAPPRPATAGCRCCAPQTAN